MADLQRLVDEIRCQLVWEECEANDELTRIAADYARVCREVNVRLRRCEEHLKLGLRSEAIHFAEVEPNLLDLVATADFAERAEWEARVSAKSLPKAEPLLLDIAEQLNEAYALQHPLEKMLDRHRLLALVRAPIIQRLATLRQLVKLDAGSTFWDADIRDFERARTVEIEAEARSAALLGNYGALQKLWEELADGEWRETRAGALAQRLTKLTEQVTRRSAPSDLDEMAAALDAAHSAGDLPKCRALRQRWHELAGPFREPHGGKPGLKWLANEDARDARIEAFQSAVSALESVLGDDESDAEHIQLKSDAVARFGRGIPEPLAVRCRKRIEAQQSAVQKRDRLFIYSAVGCVVLVACVIALVVLLT